MRDDEDDEALVLAARGGDREALATLLTRHWGLLSALCRGALGDPVMAEDAAQEAALQAMLNLDRLRQPERFGAWLGGIGLNICRRWRRYRTRDAWSWEAIVGGRSATEAIDWQPGPAEHAEVADLREQVLQAVAGLPRGQRAAVLLFYLDGMPQAEVAAALSIPVGSVKTRLHKARLALRHSLAHWQEEMRAMATPTTETGWVEARVADVRRRTEGPPHHLVILEEIAGERRLEIWVGRFEGEAIAVLLEGVEFPRPMTYALMAGLLQAGGVRVREVRISRLVEDVFYATVVVERPDAADPSEVDARPSDALALALAASIPIRVAPAVLAAAPPRDLTDEEIQTRAREQNLPEEKVREHVQWRRSFYAEVGEGAAEIAASVRAAAAGGPRPSPAPPDATTP